MARKPKEAGFESTLAELEELVECQAALQAAQQRVQVLTQRASGVALVDFDAEGTEAVPAAEP